MLIGQNFVVFSTYIGAVCIVVCLVKGQVCLCFPFGALQCFLQGVTIYQVGTRLKMEYKVLVDIINSGQPRHISSNIFKITLHWDIIGRSPAKSNDGSSHTFLNWSQYESPPSHEWPRVSKRNYVSRKREQLRNCVLARGGPRDISGHRLSSWSATSKQGLSPSRRLCEPNS